MNRRTWTTACEVIGFMIAVFGVSMFSVPVSIIAFGLGLIALGGFSA